MGRVCVCVCVCVGLGARHREHIASVYGPGGELPAPGGRREEPGAPGGLAVPRPPAGGGRGACPGTEAQLLPEPGARGRRPPQPRPHR